MKDSDWKQLTHTLSGLNIREKEPLSKHTTLNVGGPARLFIEPRTESEALSALRAIRDAGAPLLVLGNGSNLLVCDAGFDGVVMHFGKAMSDITVSGTRITAQSGAPLPTVCQVAGAAALEGLEFAAGIPATLGGAACMNAGAYGAQMCDTLVCVRCATPDGQAVDIPADRMDYGYRSSRALKEHLIVLSACFSLKEGDRDTIYEKIADYRKRRKACQPLTYPSAGSFFRRPEGHFAGALIEQAGLKGFSVGAAQVSELHAGFLINLGGATARDFIALAEKVRQIVHEKSGIWLESEVRVVGDDQA